MIPIQKQNSLQMPSLLPPPGRADAPPPTVSVETPKQTSALDKYNDIAGAFSNAVQKGLSYANARREREKYRG